MPPVPLEHGDRLSRYAFERRYERRPDVKKAGLIEGVVRANTPSRVPASGKPDLELRRVLADMFDDG